MPTTSIARNIFVGGGPPSPPTPQRTAIKEQIVKVYTQAGAFIDVWRDCPLLGSQNAAGPKFAINNISAQLTVTLPRAFAHFDEVGDPAGRGTVGAGNVVQFWVVDNDVITTGRLVYQGYIDSYQPQIADDGTESLEVILTPFDAFLGDVEFIGTQNFGTNLVSNTYVDPVTMFNWVFSPYIAANSATVITAGTTTAITLSNVNYITVGSLLYLQGTGADSAKNNGPLTVTAVNQSTKVVTFSAAIPTNSYSNTVLVAGLAVLTSATAVTGGVTAAIVVSATTGLFVNQTIGLVGSGADASKSESATILSIVSTTVTFTAPLTNSYSHTIGVSPTISFNTITNHPYTYPLTLDPTNLTVSATPFQAQLHNQTLSAWFEAVRTLAPTNWFWRCNSNKTVTFTLAPATAKHVFVIGKHISHPLYTKDYINLKNFIYVKGTGVTSTATGADITTFGQRSTTIVEDRIIDQNTSDRYAAATLADLDAVNYRSVITIVDYRGDNSNTGYDIETIQVGDTCKLQDPESNLTGSLWDAAAWDVDQWDYPPGAQINQVVTISALTYNFDSVDLELSSLQPSQDKFLVELAQQYTQSQSF